MLYAASLPKIAILLGAFVEIERGRIALDNDTRASLTRMMIRVSSNEAARASPIDPGAGCFASPGPGATGMPTVPLVEHAGHKYIAVALAADPSGSRWMTRLIRSLDAIIVAPQMAVSDGVFR